MYEAKPERTEETDNNSWGFQGITFNEGQNWKTDKQMT